MYFPGVLRKKPHELIYTIVSELDDSFSSGFAFQLERDDFCVPMNDNSFCEKYQ